MRMIDLTGEKVGRWTVLSRAENTPQGQARWLCRCECGNEATLKSIVLRRAVSRSCGCLNVEVVKARSTKHGHATGGISPTYHSWSGMVARCTSPKHKDFKNYGARGITVCDRWLTFANFLADMGERPKGMSIDREDNDRGYEPGNCRWVTAKEQARNKRNTVFVTIDGDKKPLAEWLEQIGLNRGTYADRIAAGWRPRQAIMTPAGK